MAGRRLSYGVGGEGPPLLFLHGWALGRSAYGALLETLAGRGHEVFAPCLPGFGGSEPLGGDDLSFAGYADWVAGFLEAVSVEEPVLAVGHSFGGGIAIVLAHDHPERVRSLVLVSAVGSPTWAYSGSSVRRMSERPLWEWGYRLPADLIPSALGSVPAVARDVLGNLVRDPRSLWSSAHLIRHADLTEKLEEVGRRGTPVLAVSGKDDRVIPSSSFEHLCSSLGIRGELVDGAHSWLFASPKEFADLLDRELVRLNGAHTPTGRYLRSVRPEPATERAVASGEGPA